MSEAFFVSSDIINSFMLGHTRFAYRLRKAILAASILLIALIAFEFVSAATLKGTGTNQFVEIANLATTGLSCISNKVVAEDEFNLSSLGAGLYDVDLHIDIGKPDPGVIPSDWGSV